MKNIKYIAVLCCMFAISSFSFAQAALDNGRPEGAVATPANDNVPAATTSTTEPGTAEDGTFSDQDIPGDNRPEGADMFYPEDFDFMQDEIMASTNPVEVAQKINDLNGMVEDLRRVAEELRLENQIIRESLSNCCSGSALGLSASDAYLIQNAPNPFNETSEIRYFVPGGLNDVEIRISDIKGELLKSIKIEEAGYGKLEVAASALTTGSFVYMLSVKGEIVDSKVMIITQ